MRSTYFSCLGILIVAILVTAHGSAASEDDASAASATRPTEPSKKSAAKTKAPVRVAPVYVPPRRGKPRARVGGGVRGTHEKLPTLRALVPDHVAHTARSQPTLLWDLDGLPPDTTALLFRFRLTSEEKIDPLIEVELEAPSRSGLQRIELTEFEFSLETGREYEWSVTLVSGGDRIARYSSILGWIERVEAPEGLAIRADAATLEDVVAPPPTSTLASASSDTAALAAAGLWYDAVDVANQVERAALLDQIGLAPAGVP